MDIYKIFDELATIHDKDLQHITIYAVNEILKRSTNITTLEMIYTDIEGIIKSMSKNDHDLYRSLAVISMIREDMSFKLLKEGKRG